MSEARGQKHAREVINGGGHLLSSVRGGAPLTFWLYGW